MRAQDEGHTLLARQMAYERVSHEAIARILDAAEELPRFVAERDDRTDAFRTVLAELAEEFPALGSALERFDREPTPASW